MGIDFRSMALNMISKNPRVSQNPMAQSMIDAIRTNDSVRGEQIATNLCASYGMSKEQALNEAKRFFRI